MYAVGIYIFFIYLSRILVPPTVEAIQFPSVPVRMHSSFRLSCMASGIPTPLVQWTRFDEPVQATLNGRVQLPEMGLLVVNFAWKNDSGQYECWARSRAGTHKKVISVIVYGKWCVQATICTCLI